MGEQGEGGCSCKVLATVDRSAAYALSYEAKDVVAAGVGDYCEIQVSYAIGVAEPKSININTFDSEKISKEKHLIDLNYTYVIFGKNNVYKDKFSNVLNEVNKTFKRVR